MNEQQNKTTTEPRPALRYAETEDGFEALYRHGDCRLVWVNAGDLATMEMRGLSQRIKSNG